MNPQGFENDAVTPGYQSIEQYKDWQPPMPNYPDHRPNRMPRLSSPTNIFQIGQTMLAVMTLQIAPQPNYNSPGLRDVFAIWSRRLGKDLRTTLKKH